MNDRLDAVFGPGFTTEAAAEVQADLAQRYVQIRAVIEWADARATSVPPETPCTGGKDMVAMREADWNRIVAVARGHVRALSGGLS